jgi:hypothetical protein
MAASSTGVETLAPSPLAESLALSTGLLAFPIVNSSFPPPLPPSLTPSPSSSPQARVQCEQAPMPRALGALNTRRDRRRELARFLARGCRERACRNPHTHLLSTARDSGVPPHGATTTTLRTLTASSSLGQKRFFPIPKHLDARPEHPVPPQNHHFPPFSLSTSLDQAKLLSTTLTSPLADDPLPSPPLPCFPAGNSACPSPRRTRRCC